jgi:hypothetical protein
MAKFDLGKYGRDAIIPAVTINMAGAVEPKLDNWLNAKVKILSSNAAINTNAKYAKYAKAGLYTGLGLVSQAAAMVIDGGDGVDMIGEGAGTFFYGLSGATLAEDPVMNVPGGFRLAGNPQGAAPARQAVTKTANFIS